MGQVTYSCIGCGMTVEAARRDAIARDREANGHQDGYTGTIGSATGYGEKAECLVQPVPGKGAVVERTPRRGALKWETRYTAEAVGGEVVVSEKTLGACLRMARAYSQANAAALRLRVTKVLVEGQGFLGTVSPKQAVMGKWRFSGEAKC